jgi:hypothetical protein
LLPSATTDQVPPDLLQPAVSPSSKVSVKPAAHQVRNLVVRGGALVAPSLI